MLRVPQNTTAVTTPVATGGGFFVSGCLSYYFLAFCILCTNDVAVLFLQLVLCHISYGKVLRVFPYIHPDTGMFFLLRFFVFLIIITSAVSSTDRQIDRAILIFASCVNRSRVFHYFRIDSDCLLAGDSPGCYYSQVFFCFLS